MPQNGHSALSTTIIHLEAAEGEYQEVRPMRALLFAIPLVLASASNPMAATPPRYASHPMSPHPAPRNVILFVADGL